MYTATVMLRSVISFLISLIVAVPASAIIVQGGNGRLLTPPTSPYTQSGVQYIGTWGSFVGTAIGPHHFLTAVHVQGGVGDSFVLDDKAYTAEARTIIPGTDLAVWRVKQTLPRWAPLYDKPDEMGKEAILYGRGCQRGQLVIANGEIQGWLWGKDDSTLSWGRNRVAGTTSLPGNKDVLIFAFEDNTDPLTGTVGRGDSGGGVFLQEGTTWKLAGVNFASGGQYSRTATGQQPFMAALTNARGLYQNNHGTWLENSPYTEKATSTLAFATRISPYNLVIRAVMKNPSAKNESHPLSRRTLAMIVLILLGSIVGIGVAMSKRKVSSRSSTL